MPPLQVQPFSHAVAQSKQCEDRAEQILPFLWCFGIHKRVENDLKEIVIRLPYAVENPAISFRSLNIGDEDVLDRVFEPCQFGLTKMPVQPLLKLTVIWFLLSSTVCHR